LSQRLGYFFLFPNICFPLFPVIDYQTFKRTYFDRAEPEIYQKGIDWIFRGLIHLLLYRVVYHYFVPDPLAIRDFAGVGQYVLSSFLLYLRISGLFHLIVGILCLFGCNLPETHHRYFLADSFTDFWRRINIYWKDFMVKLFYFPMFLSLRRWGTTRAMILATLATFFVTWLLHSYQWFWLRGSFPLHPQDMIFWGVLAILVTGNSIYEVKYGRNRRSLTRNAKPDFRQALGRAARTATVFVVICVLWSFWTSTSIDQWLAIMSLTGTASAVEILVLGLVLLAAIAIGVIVQLFGKRDSVQSRSGPVAIPRRAAWIGAATMTLIACYFTGINVHPRATSVIAILTGDQLNTRDQQQLVKGYYEELLGGESSGSMVWSVRLEEPATWKWNGRKASEYRIRTNDVRVAEWRPHITAIHKGQIFTTNQWGMRDQEYGKAKPPGTFRIAMLGSSHTVGAGVPLEDTFQSLVERRLNSGDAGQAGRKVEILNFAYAGDSVLGRLARFQMRALELDIDAVVDVSVSGEGQLAIKNLRQAVIGRTPGLDPVLLEIVRRARVTAEMSSEQIDSRLAPFVDEILRFGYRQLALAASKNEVDALVLVLPGLDDTDAIYRAEWESLSRMMHEAGLEAVSLEGVYGPLSERSTLKLASWDWHPNSAGHALIARRVHRELFRLDGLTSIAGGIASVSTNAESNARQMEVPAMADDYETIKKTLKTFILEDFLPGEDPGALEDSTPLITGGVLDSIATIRFATFVDATYGVDLEAHELSPDYIDTLSAMATLVHSKLRERKPQG
ncbi:MAG: hypothetical protein ACREST_03155, partial [Steroidobacteraceae bacterium]